MLLGMVNEAEPAWSNRKIRERVAREVERRGMSYSDLPPMYAPNKEWGPQGPTLRTLTDGARALDWTLAQLLGIETKPEQPVIDERIIQQAVKMTLELIPPHIRRTPPEEYDIVAGRVVYACKSIAELAQESPELAFSDGALRAISMQLRDLFARSVSEKS